MFSASAPTQAFSTAEPSTIVLNAGDFVVRGPGGAYFRSTAAGDVLATRDLVAGRDLRATGDVQASQMGLTSVVAENSPCTDPTRFARAAGGGLASCVGGQWRTASSFAAVGDVCGAPGAYAAETSGSGRGLICRGSRWQPMSWTVQSMQLVDVVSVRGNGSPVNKPVCPAAETGLAGAMPMIILTPAADSFNAAASSINRFATDAGAQWLVFVQDSSGTPLLNSELLAHVYCFYPSLSVGP